MTCCFVKRIREVERVVGKCAMRIGDWHPTDGTRPGSQITMLRDNGDSEYGHGTTPCEAFDELERSLGIEKLPECVKCAETLSD